MKCLDLSLPTPAENLACDEALLDWCEERGGGEILRFWESDVYFVVLGYSNRLESEVHRAACEAGGIGIYRRCSGGGAVLQGPGCLNYALILRIEEQGPLGTVSATNRWVLERNGAALDRLIAKPECGSGARDGAEGPVGKAHVTRVGHTDLALNSLKFSGNSQRRRRRFLLFHGTCLLRFDLGRVARLLPMPTREPAYRRHRPHLDFLTNLDLPAAAVKAELRREWGAVEPLESAPLEAIGLLARDKYATAAWNLKF